MNYYCINRLLATLYLSLLLVFSPTNYQTVNIHFQNTLFDGDALQRFCHTKLNTNQRRIIATVAIFTACNKTSVINQNDSKT